ncbi:MAG: DUF2334 domain-containing protein [Thermodesulfovibrionales bacterium]
MTVIFRFDDFSSGTPTGMIQDIIDAFKKSKAPLTVAVIPFFDPVNYHDPSRNEEVPLSPAHAKILQHGFSDGIVDVALHGNTHKTIAGKRLTEFSGLDPKIQTEKLAKGKKLLEGVINAPVTVFVPPWNTYDLNTLRALENLGLPILSASKKGDAPEERRLKYLPASTDLLRIRDAVETARTSSDTQPVIVVLFHIFDFTEIDKKLGKTSFQGFVDQLNWLRTQEDVRVLSVSQAAEAIRDLSARRLLFNRRNYCLSRLLPAVLREKEAVWLYQEYRAFPPVLLRVAGFYLTLVFIAVLILRRYRRRKGPQT